MSLADRVKRWKTKASELKRDTYALYLAVRDPEVPWYVKALGVLVVGYALSPIDLIPDFIPILGYLDDLVLIPAGIALIRKLLPPGVMERCRERASRELAGAKLRSIPAAVIIGLLWLLVAAALIKILVHTL